MLSLCHITERVNVLMTPRIVGPVLDTLQTSPKCQRRLIATVTEDATAFMQSCWEMKSDK